VLAAVRNATLEIQSKFEEQFGPIAMAQYVIAAEWVESKTSTEDGRVERVRYEGDSVELIDLVL